MLLNIFKQSLKNLKYELYIFNKHRKGLKKAQKYNKNSNLKLHLGCGNIYKKGWINIDLFSDQADLNLDLRKKIPFPDNSCEEIYSEHFLEHLSYPDEALHLLTELKRIIKPGKKVVTVVPDTYWPLKSYIEGNKSDYFRIAIENKWHPDYLITPLEQINYHFRQDGEHLFAYDEETLIHILKKAGFTSVKARNFDPDTDSDLRHPGSLYIESIK